MSRGTCRFTRDSDSISFQPTNSVRRCVQLSKTKVAGVSIRRVGLSCDGLCRARNDETAGITHDERLRAPRPLSLPRRIDPSIRSAEPGTRRGLDKATPEQLSGAAPFSPTGNPNETVGTLLASIAFCRSLSLANEVPIPLRPVLDHAGDC